MSDRGPTSASGLITHDLPCARCDYNLRTLPRDGRCPECGTSVERSLVGLSNNAAVRAAAGLGWVSAGLVVHILAPLTLFAYPIMALVARMLLCSGENELAAALRGTREPLRASAHRVGASGGAAVLLTIGGWLWVAVLLLRLVFGTPVSPMWLFVALAAAELPAFVNGWWLNIVCRNLAAADRSPKLADGFRNTGRFLVCGGVGALAASAPIVATLAGRTQADATALLPVAAALMMIEFALIAQAALTVRLRRHLLRKT